MTNVDNFTEKAKALIAYLKESFSQEELLELAKEFDGSNVLSVDNVDGDIEVPPEETLGYIAPVDDGSTLSDGETIQTTTNTMSVPFESAPKFRIYWRAWKEGNSSSGQTESSLETAQMARAEAMTKLYDLGFTDLEILAIETIKSEEKPETQI